MADRSTSEDLVSNDDDQMMFYKYPIYKQFICIFFVFMIFGAVAFLGSGGTKNAVEIVILVFLLLAGIFFIPISFASFFGCSELSIDGNGISSYKFGIRMKSIRWKNIKKIEKKKIIIAYPYRKKEGFTIIVFDDSIKKYRFFLNFLGPITFNDGMFFANELLHKVEEYAEQYGIPIIEPNN